MKYQASQQNSFSVLSFQEDIYASNSQEFSELLQARIAAGDLKLILDFTGVKLIDSSGITAIAKHYRTMSEKGGKIILAGCSPTVKKVFTMVGFNQFFKMVGTLQEALQEKP